MMNKRLLATAILVATLSASSIGVQATGVCWMIYQVADNNLETFLRADFEEITKSPVLQDYKEETNLQVWVYFDHGTEAVGGLPGVFDSTGNPVTMKPNQGSDIMRFDTVTKRMLLVETTPEQNSDSPGPITYFMTQALTDCLSKGTTETFLTLSGHGGGFYGYGGDDVKRRNRKLVQSNDSIIAGIRAALQNVATETRLTVLGFDACLMQSFGALDDYRDVTQYLLASEATEPGHGWAYNFLDTAETALDMAKNLHANFLGQKQGYSKHLVPKTMAIVESAGYNTFLQAWDLFCAEMAKILRAGGDPAFVAVLSRARSAAFAFPSVLDSTQGNTPSAMDIGSFFKEFEALCTVSPSSPLYQLLQDAETAYNLMFVERGVAERTPAEATGMAITWPFKDRYYNDKRNMDFWLFENPYATTDSPGWLGFLRAFYETTTPDQDSEAKTCQRVIVSTVGGDGKLLLNPKIDFEIGTDDKNITVKSDLALSVDFILVSHGIDVSPLIDNETAKEEVFGRRLRTPLPEHQESRRGLEDFDLGQPGAFDRAKRAALQEHRRRAIAREVTMQEPGTQRRTQIFDDSSRQLLYGGDSYVDYKGAGFESVWDRGFWMIFSNETIDLIFVHDLGFGQKAIPLCYFGPESTITRDDLFVGLTETEAKEQLGCQSAYATFSTLGAVTVSDEFHIYVYTENEETGFSQYAELSEEGGYAAPIFYADLEVEGVEYNEFVGGLSKSLIPIVRGAALVLEADAGVFLEVFNVSSIILDVYAVNFDAIATNVSETELDEFVDRVYFNISSEESETPPPFSAASRTWSWIVVGTMTVFTIFTVSML